MEDVRPRETVKELTCRCQSWTGFGDASHSKQQFVAPGLAAGCLQNLQVESYGTGAKVKLPGESLESPNVYEFGTKYTFMLEDLQSKSEEYYRKRGLIQMLERNSSIKGAPERWQAAE